MSDPITNIPPDKDAADAQSARGSAAEIAAAGRKMSQPTAARSTIETLLSRIVTLPVQMVTSILVIRALGTEGTGIYTFLALFGSFVLPLATLGFGASIIYFISSGRYAVRDVYFASLFIGLLQGAFSASVLGGLWYWDVLGESGTRSPAELMVPMLLLLPVQGAHFMITRVLLGASMFRANNLLTVVTAMLQAATMLIFVVGVQWSVLGTVVSMVSTTIVVLVGISITIARRYPPTWTINTEFIHAGFVYGVKAWIGDVAIRANLRLDQWILGMLSPVGLGLYKPAVTMAELVWLLPDSLALVFFNRIAGAADAEERAALTERVHRVVLWLMVAAAVVLGATAPWFIPLLYGEKNAAASLPFVLLMPGTVALAVSKMLNKYFAGIAKPHYSSATVTLGAVVGIGLYVALIPAYGEVGAAIGSSLGYVVTSIAAVYVYRKLVAPRKTRLFRPEVSDAIWLEQQARAAIGRQRPAGS